METRKLLPLTGIALMLLCCTAGAEDKAEAPFKMASLVLPQGISFELGPVTLTRVLDTATNALSSATNSLKARKDNSGVKKTDGSGVESVRSFGHSSGRNLGGSIGGSTGGSEGFSLLGLLGLHADVGGQITAEDSFGDKNANHNGVERVKEFTYGSKNGTTSEIEEVEQYGSYHLKFSVTFKSKDLHDTFQVGGPNARVILEGFSAPVPVPYTERKEPIRLRAEERTLFFDYPLSDQVLLRDAKRMVAQRRRNAVTLSLIGDEFPVISERTKDNVISEITRTMRLSPNTLVAVDFGDVRRLSPWRVRRKFTKASGRRGERLTIRDALLALNETIAEYEEMPDKTFIFEKGGSLVSVSDTPVLARPRKGDVKLVLFSVVGNDSQDTLEVHFPSVDFLKRPLADFSEVRLVVGSLAELAQTAVSVPDRVAGLRAEIESVLPSVPEVDKFWEEQLVQFETEKMAVTEKSQEEKAAKNAEKEFGENEGRWAGETKSITLPGGATLELVWCPSGSFTMGSPVSEDGREDDEKQHQVKLTKGFWLGKYEVTQRQWESVMGSNPSKFKGSEMPVETVSWEDCQAFIRAVQREIAWLKVRLPTEAEWEYACRAGEDGTYPGNGILKDIGWYDDNSGSRTHVVGTKLANEWGLCDMVGNVYEWCSDWYGEYSSDLEIDPVGSAEGTGRVICGGSWFSVARNCRSAGRDRRRPSFRSILLGFRLCCSTEPRE